ncbi:MAG TPA: heme exporter protein CcmD [Dongiaceae bacterium]|nr:heme exporter protein CcmD [Dongiaceae bacterium]
MTEAMNNYLLMGGYAAYIWPAYGVAALVLIAFAIDSWRRVRQSTTALRRLEAQIAARDGTGRGGAAGNKPGGTAVSGKPQQRASDQQATGS